MNSSKPLNHRGWHSRGYLPHLDSPAALQSITFRLRDALPRVVLERLKQESVPSVIAKQRIEAWLDSGHGECLLANADLAGVVEKTLLFFDAERYALLAWCIMPNHVHVLIEPFIGWPLDKVIGSWKTYSARSINRVLNRSGQVWQREYFDRYIRDDAHLTATIDYIECNPVKAGLVKNACDWRFSSAAYKADR